MAAKVTVLVKDMAGLINFVIKERGFSGHRLKLGLDGGGGFLKATLNVIEQAPFSPPSSPVAKKAPSLGGDRFLDTGVKKLFIVGIAQGVPESYENMKLLLQQLSITPSFCTSTDLKLSNIIVGLGLHSSSCPCTWCEAHKDDFKSNFTAPLCTFGRICQQARLFKLAVQSRQKFPPQQFFSCLEEPILNCPDSLLVLDAIAPSQLHLMMGVTAKIWDELLNRLSRDPGADRSVVNEWARTNNLAKKEYRGGIMEGNQCRSLRRKSLDLVKKLPPKYNLFALVLHRFDAVVSSCFGMNVQENYLQTINDFKTAYGN